MKGRMDGWMDGWLGGRKEGRKEGRGRDHIPYQHPLNTALTRSTILAQMNKDKMKPKTSEYPLSQP